VSREVGGQLHGIFDQERSLLARKFSLIFVALALSGAFLYTEEGDANFCS
jgi:hypothetical protein